jgi:hypothetical protein
MSHEQDMKDIVAQLDRLQIQQSELLQRLDQLVESGESNNATARSVRSTRSIRSEITQEFAIGDRVRIRNPGLLQAVRGTIIKIGSSRITVQARNGNKIM